MSVLMPLLLLLLIALNSMGISFHPTMEIKDVDTEYEILCTDSSGTMDFANLTISEIKENFLSSPIITCLDFQHNKIHRLDFNAFNNLPNLKYLQMSFNPFDLNNVFRNDFQKLEILILDHLQVNDSTLDIPETYPNLRKLFLRHTNSNIYYINTSKNSFPSLTHLYLSGNQHMSCSFEWLPATLEYLDLSNLNIRQLALRDLRNLKRLLVHQSVGRSIDSLYLEELSNLQYLSASSNGIRFPSEIYLKKPSSLVYLDLSDNIITYLFNEYPLHGTQNLRLLNLSRNNMKFIGQEVFRKLANLETLILEKNSITAIPVITYNLKLKTLMLNCNNIRNITNGVFNKNTDLQLLSLHDNEISYIDEEAFTGLRNLKILTLSNNKLSVLPTNWMLPMTSLVELDLAGNDFTIFAHLSINNSTTLRNVYLSNQILYMQTSLLVDLPPNATINFDQSFILLKNVIKTIGTGQITIKFRTS